MARTFSEHFSAYQGANNTRPYMILQIDWSSGTKYYLDRPLTDFVASGARAPAEDIADELVASWGQITLTLKETVVGGVDAWTVSIIDDNRNLRSILNAEAQQRRMVKLYRMWDEDDCVWPDDAALIFVGSLRPHQWTSSEGIVELEVEDASKRLLRQVELLAQQSVFSRIPEEYRDRNIPLVWGQAHRVEAVLVDRPWRTVIREAIPRSSSPPITIPIDDHPDDMLVEELGNDSAPIEFWLGTDLVEGYLTQSSTPDTTPSAVTITAWQDVSTATAVIDMVFGTGAGRFAVLSSTKIEPMGYQLSLDSAVTGGTACVVLQNGEWVPATVATITPNDPSLGLYKITFVESEVRDALTAWQAVKFFSVSAENRIWPAGTTLRPKEGNYVYACNALPSKKVVKVEGFGELADDAGGSRKGFILLGGSLQDGFDGSDTEEDQVTDAYTVNLDDDTWADDLDRNLTTITFDKSPRQVNPSLEDERIWVTLQGVEDQGDSFGTLVQNPALVVLRYLEHFHLMDVDPEDIDATSFSTAAAALSSLRVGFAQLQPMDGLTQLQDICRQCRSILLFDQGKVAMKVLSNSPGASQASFDNDNIAEGSLSYREISVDDIVTRLSAKWRDSWDDRLFKPKDIVATNLGAEEEFGRVARDIDLYLYGRRTYAVSEVAFWLNRWSKLWKEVEFTTFSDALHLQPADWITLSWTEDGATIFNNRLCEVLEVTDDMASHAVRIRCRYAAFSF